jgi:hypothetical protein
VLAVAAVITHELPQQKKKCRQINWQFIFRSLELLLFTGGAAFIDFILIDLPFELWVAQKGRVIFMHNIQK